MSQTAVLTTYEDAKRWSMFSHLSFILDYVIPFSGLIVCIAIFLTKGKEDSSVYENSRQVLNFRITSFCITIISIFLCLLILAVFMFVFKMDQGAVAIMVLGFCGLINIPLWIYSLVSGIWNGILAADGKEATYCVSYDFIKSK